MQNHSLLATETDKTNMIERLEKLIDKNPNACLVKEYRLKSGNPIIAKMQQQIRVCKTKPKKIPAGVVLKELHPPVFWMV